jgi:hypothetical protein
VTLSRATDFLILLPLPVPVEAADFPALRQISTGLHLGRPKGRWEDNIKIDLRDI